MEESVSIMHYVSWSYEFSSFSIGLLGRSPVFSYQICTFKKLISLVLCQSYKWCHHCRGMTQSLNSCIRPLLKVMVVSGHVEWWECWATTLHWAGYGRRCKRHSQAAVWRQRSLDWMRDGCSYGCSAGTKGSQGLWVLKSRKTGWRGNPGAEG